MASSPARPTSSSPEDRQIAALAVASGLAATLSSAAPTGIRTVDVAFLALTGGFVVVATARARRWSWLVLAGLAAGTSHGLWLVAGWGSLVGALVATAGPRRRRVLGAGIGAVALQALLHQPAWGFHGTSALVGAVAIAVVAVSAHRRTPARARRRNGWIATGVALAAVAAAGAFGVAVVLAYGHLGDGETSARQALDQARRGDTDGARRSLAQAADELRQGQSVVEAPWARVARLVPVVSQQVEAVDVTVDEAITVAAAGRATASVADYHGLKYRSGRIDLEKVAALEAPMGRAAAIFGDSQARLAGIDHSWLAGPLDRKLTAFQGDLATATHDARSARSVLRVLPGLLGGQGTRHYVVMFTNTAEARGLGGLFGNYGELTAVDGKVRLTRSGPTTDLERTAPNGTRTLTGLREFQARYGSYQPADYLRDLAISPQFPDVAEAVRQLYPQATGTRVDGVIAMDPDTVAALLRFTGPIRVPGYDVTLTSTNAADVIVRQQYLQFADQNGRRKDILVDATKIAFDRLLGGSLPSPSALARVLGPLVQQRRLLLAAHRSSEQAVFARLGLAGSIRTPAGTDALLVTSQNYGNSKIDAYLHRRIAYDAVVDPTDGSVEATETITLRNDASVGLPRYVVGNTRGAPIGTNLMNLAVYSPSAVRSVTVDGKPVTVASLPEAGLTAATLVVAIPPRSSVTVRLHLHGGVDLRPGTYRLHVLPQPMANPDELSVTVRVGRGRDAPIRYRSGDGKLSATRRISVTLS